MEDANDHASVETVARDIFYNMLIAQNQAGLDNTETVLWIALQRAPDGRSVHWLARTVGRDRKTVRRRLAMMAEDGTAEYRDGAWRVTPDGMERRAGRFGAVWEKLDPSVKEIILAECERRKKK